MVLVGFGFRENGRVLSERREFIMPRTYLTPQQRQKTRDRIRKVAASLCKGGDPRELTVRAVAKEANISVGTIYRYFENISDLLRSLWQEPVDDLRAEMAAIAEATKDPLKRIELMLEAYANFAEEQEQVFRGIFLLVRPETSIQPEKRALDSEPFFEFLSTAIVEGQKSGQIIEGDEKMLAQLLWAALHGSLSLPINIDVIDFTRPAELAREMIQHLMKVVSKE